MTTPPTPTPEKPEKPKKGLGIDRQDVLLVVGVAALLAGVAMWTVPGALIVLGVMCLGSVVLIERAKQAELAKKATN